jgi:hypothetical protein
MIVMIRTRIMLLARVILVTSGVAQQPQQSGGLQDPPWLKLFAFKRIVYSVPDMTRVKVSKILCSSARLLRNSRWTCTHRRWDIPQPTVAAGAAIHAFHRRLLFRIGFTESAEGCARVSN